MARGRRRVRGLRPFRLAQEIFDRLEAIHRELLRRRSQKPSPVTVNLDLKADLHTLSRSEARRKFASSLVGWLAEEVRSSVVTDEVFVLGRVYCYWCESALCAHSSPPAPSMVFSGYAPTGQPVWEDFVSVCLNRGDPRIDRLHRSPPQPFSIFVEGGDIHKNQLNEFGARSNLFRVCYQALIGYLPFENGSSSGKIALTIQVILTKRPGSRRQLRLNVIGKTPPGEEIAKVVDPLSRLSELFLKADRRLRNLSVQREPEASQIQSILKHVALGVERIYRQAHRRTKHAQLRHSDRTRPAGPALRDVVNAKQEDFLLDSRRNTFVVLGPNGRVHIFNEQGLHVTSLSCGKEEVGRRISKKIWKPLSSDQVERVRENILREAEAASAE